jgi:hypothetical protein
VEKRVFCRSENLLRDETRVSNSLANSPISESFKDNMTLDNNKRAQERVSGVKGTESRCHVRVTKIFNFTIFPFELNIFN